MYVAERVLIPARVHDENESEKNNFTPKKKYTKTTYI